MNLVEALRTNKQVTRKFWANINSEYWICSSLTQHITLTVDDMMADDWMVVERKIELNENELKVILKKALQKTYETAPFLYEENSPAYHVLCKHILNELGFT